MNAMDRVGFAVGVLVILVFISLSLLDKAHERDEMVRRADAERLGRCWACGREFE